jgi:hypothetical protein
MALLNTGTQTDGPGGANRTGTHVSTNIIIKVGNISVGAVQKISFDEKRTIYQLKEVGADAIVDSVPQSPAEISGSCERVRFDGLRMMMALGRPFVHLKSQRFPFDFKIIDTFYSNDEATHIITTVRNVWVNSLGYSYNADNFTIAENMNWQAEDIYSTINGKNIADTSIAGARNDVFAASTRNRFEMEADRGVRRGALDAAGLLVAIDRNL